MSSSSPPEGGGPGDTEVRRRKTRSQTKAEESSELKPENETGLKEEVENDPQTPTPEGTAQLEQGSVPLQQQYYQPQPVYQEVLVVPPNRIIFAIPKWIVYTLTIVFGILFIALGGYVGDVIYKKYFFLVPSMPNMTFSAMGDEGLEFFKKFDRDEDLRLSLDEFETIYHTLVSSGINVTADLLDKQNQYTIGKDEKTITVQAYFQPLLLETMNSDLNDTSEDYDSLIGLRTWKKVNIEKMDIGVKQFYGFLPPNQTFIDKLGEVYEIFGQNSTSLPDIPSHRSSNKYIPPRVEDEIVVIHQLLTMFHPRPFLRTRFPPQGGTACVRAVNEEYLDISFRIHAEFQLSDPPHNPMWYTPGQFTGNLIVTRDFSKIVYFHMYVPTDKKLNVDMEWITDIQMAASMQVDIGFMPQMEVRMIDQATNTEVKEPDQKWKREITETEARRKLEIKMYPFKQVPYYNFTESFDRAQKENKLVHSILLWGALDDQSC